MERSIRVILDSVSQQDLQCYVLCPLVIQLDKKVRIIETISYWAVTLITKYKETQRKSKKICNKMQEKRKKQQDLIKYDVGLFGIEWKKFDISLFRCYDEKR